MLNILFKITILKIILHVSNYISPLTYTLHYSRCYVKCDRSLCLCATVFVSPQNSSYFLFVFFLRFDIRNMKLT